MKTKSFRLGILLWLLLVAHASAFYEPGLQRWINRDPILERGGISVFQFVWNSPVHKADGWGLRLIIVPGGPSGFPACVANAQAEVANTRVGEQLGGLLAERDVFVTPGSSTSTGTAFGDTPEITLAADDANFIPEPFYKHHPDEVPRVPIVSPATGAAVVLGHELGHALLGLSDPQNVILVENPIRENLGIAMRPTYHGVPFCSEAAPTCPCFDE